MTTFDAELDAAAGTSGFSGVVRVDVAGAVVRTAAFGLADRRSGATVEESTQFGIASGTKLVTALVVLSLVTTGELSLETPARAVLGDDLPLIDDTVTVEHLLAHRSGIGDYLDESLYDDGSPYELPVPAQWLWSTEQYVQILDGHPQVFEPGADFAYNNGGFVVLALMSERAGATPFDELVRERVCQPAGLVGTAFLRSDELPSAAAIGYVSSDGLRTNVFDLPVLGSGDGGLYSTASDVTALWSALLGGRIVPEHLVQEMRRPRSDSGSLRYGLGLWLHPDGDVLEFHGYDVGVSFRSMHHVPSDTTATFMSNTGEGTGAVGSVLERLVRA
jgi:CubicO group peptidase (beta-lactamase class C family)